MSKAVIERTAESLEFLFRLYPPDGMVIIGQKSIEWVKYARDFPIKHIHYVDAEPKNTSRIKSLHGDSRNMHCHEIFITDTEGVAPYHHYSNSLLNGSTELQYLKPLWKNLKLIKAKQKKSTTLPAFVKSLPTRPNYLILDTMSAQSIIDGSDAKMLEMFEVIIISYVTAISSHKSKKKYDSYLSEYLFRPLQSIPHLHPQIHTIIYLKDYKQQARLDKSKINKVENELDKAKLRHRELAAELKHRKQKTEQVLKEVSTLKELNGTLEKRLKQQTEESQKQIESLRAQHEEAQSQSHQQKEAYELAMEKLNQDIEELSGSKQQSVERESALKEELHREKNQTKEIQKKYNDLISTIQNQEKSIVDVAKEIQNSTANLKNYIAKKSTLTAYEIESFININNYLSEEKLPLNFHGWPISPDIALYMIEKIENEKYDLTMEFGSGTSTLLFAELNKVKKIKNKHIAFDHNEHYYKKTLTSLQNRGLQEYANVAHAPLRMLKYKENEFNYYDCEKYLEEASALKPKKILILVDGPPGNTNYLARFPVMLFILENFTECEIHIILDDYYREEEKKSAKMWEELLEEKNIPFSTEIENNEKGLYALSFNIAKSAIKDNNG